MVVQDGGGPKFLEPERGFPKSFWSPEPFSTCP